MSSKVKRNLVIVAVLLFVGAASYLNWSYNQKWALEDETAQVYGLEETGAETLGGETVLSAEAEEPVYADSEGYFAQARLTREQSRDEALSLLQEAAAAEGATQEIIDSAVNAISVMAQRTMVESQMENTLVAKGFADAVVYMSDEAVTVAVAAPEGGLTEAEVARITECVTADTAYPVSAIQIIEIGA